MRQNHKNSHLSRAHFTIARRSRASRVNLREPAFTASVSGFQDSKVLLIYWKAPRSLAALRWKLVSVVSRARNLCKFPRRSRTNNMAKLSDYDCVGFDLDHTLIQYKLDNLYPVSDIARWKARGNIKSYCRVFLVAPSFIIIPGRHEVCRKSPEMPSARFFRANVVSLQIFVWYAVPETYALNKLICTDVRLKVFLECVFFVLIVFFSWKVVNFENEVKI